jgi:polysaccharide export outer membrane protein
MKWIATMGVRPMRWVWVLALAVVPLVFGVATVRAQEYVVGPEDVLQISVWMHPELEKTVTVSADGMITFAPIGDLKAAGLTPTQLADRLGDRLSTYLRQTSTVTVTVTQFLSHSIYISGAVAKPGRYGFEKVPGIVDAINQAGGAVPGADLSQVQIIRREGDRRRTLTVDVASAMRDGGSTNLPALKPGDTIVISAGLGGVVAPGDASGVMGEVSKPGLYPVGAGQDLWTLLAAAGGLTTRGNLSDVKVITRTAGGQAVVSVNLRDQLQHGTRNPFVVHAGDVVFVQPSGASALGRTWTGFTQALSVSRDLLNLVIVADYLHTHNR